MEHYKSIVVAVDGSKESEYALHKAIGTALRNEGAALNIVNVVDTRLFEAYDPVIFKNAKAKSEELLDKYKTAAVAAGVKNIHAMIEQGSPKTAITKEVAEKVHADLIVCGATGLNAVERFLMGSVSAAIVRTAPCDVLVARTPE